jgi:protein SCO1/2
MNKHGIRRWAGSGSLAVAMAGTAWLGVQMPTAYAGGSQGMSQPMEMDHCMHQMSAPKATARTTAFYDVPDVTLTGTNGEKVSLRSELDKGPVMVNFIFTTCTTICPTLSATFAEVQDRLAAEGVKGVRLVSISIDPEHDTPDRLKRYAEKYGAGPDWRFLTGSLADSITVQRAFDAYRGDKMNHVPLTLMRVSPKSAWVRIDGFESAANLVSEYQREMSKTMASR